jgi:hypothetical protein
MGGRPKGGGLEGVTNPHEIRWFRQKGESRKAYEAFAVYRDMGMGRSLPKVAERLDKSLELMKRWSARHEWVDRAASFDANEDFELLVRTQEQRIQMRVNDAKIARLFKQKVVDRLQQLEPKDLSPTQLAHWFEVAVKVERLSLGEATGIVQPHASECGDELSRAIEENPELADLAADLLAATRRVREDEGYGAP